MGVDDVQDVATATPTHVLKPSHKEECLRVPFYSQTEVPAHSGESHSQLAELLQVGVQGVGTVHCRGSLIPLLLGWEVGENDWSTTYW